MSESTIYHFLRNAGMTRAGALGFMGNMGWESGFRSNNVEDRYHKTGRTDEQYTASVDNGSYSRKQFAEDEYGYGLCQWTYQPRKEGLYDLAKKRGVSISDESMQLDYLLMELKRDFSSLFSYLCRCESMYDATEKVCKQFENPLVKNIGDRYEIACKCANKAYDSGESEQDSGCTENDACPIDFGSTESCTISVRMLRKGDKGRDVYLLQKGLEDMGCEFPQYGTDGDFGEETENALKDMQRNCNLPVTGIADADTWQVIFQ